MPPDGAQFPTGVNTFSYLPKTTYSEQGSIARELVSATNESLMPVGIAAASFVYLRVYGGAVTLRITSALGTTQVVPCDEVFFLVSTTSPITAITVSGTAQIEGIIAGA
jgi:hypothetical protein